MLDANNGYNLNLAKHVLAETAGCGIVWLEEPFHEDDVLYRDLRAWLAQHDLAVLIADGEGRALGAGEGRGQQKDQRRGKGMTGWQKHGISLKRVRIARVE